MTGNPDREALLDHLRGNFEQLAVRMAPIVGSTSDVAALFMAISIRILVATLGKAAAAAAVRAAAANIEASERECRPS